jgi:hypothetical protein
MNPATGAHSTCERLGDPLKGLAEDGDARLDVVEAALGRHAPLHEQLARRLIWT